MQQYKDSLRRLTRHGYRKKNQTGVDTISLFGELMRFDLKQGFPLATTTFTPFKRVVSELLWLLSGSQDRCGHFAPLHAEANHCGDELNQSDISSYPNDGSQWRRWPGRLTRKRAEFHQEPPIDQIANVIERLKADPDDQRLVVPNWNVVEVESGDLARLPSPTMFQFWTRPLCGREQMIWLKNIRRIDHARSSLPNKKDTDPGIDKEITPVRALSCHVEQRSAEVVRDIPVSIALFALLTHMIAQCVGMVADELVWVGTDYYIDVTHLEHAKTILARTPKKSPKLVMNQEITDIDSFTAQDIKIKNYKHHPKLEQNQPRILQPHASAIGR